MAVIGATNPHARRLRQEMSDAEIKLWLAVRDRRLLGHKFRRQATIGPYVVDFLCVERKLIVELDGGQHSEASDAARTRVLEARGYRVTRFWNHDVLTNLDGVLAALAAALDGPSPNPLPQAGEGFARSRS
jgi:very-short-patch-repair endonuclease